MESMTTRARMLRIARVATVASFAVFGGSSCVYMGYSSSALGIAIAGGAIDIASDSGQSLPNVGFFCELAGIPHIEFQPQYLRGPSSCRILLPLWIPTLVVACWMLGMTIWCHVCRDRFACANCGYCLRGVGSDRCPECGCATKLGKGASHDGTVT